MGCVKYTLFVFNLICWLAGVVFIGLGVGVLKQVGDIKFVLPEGLDMIPISIIVFGSVIFIVSFTGCYGAVKESKCLLVLYAIVMTILLCLNIGLAYVVWTRKEDLLDKSVKYAFDNHRDNFNALERVFKCCGTTGANSYSFTDVPLTCCPDPVKNVCGMFSHNYPGCTNTLKEYINKHGNIIAYTDVGTIIVQLLTVVAAIYLTCSLKRNGRRGKQFY